MLHFHHVDGGMPVSEKPEFLRGRNGLVSFEYQQDLGVALDNCNQIILDNGAFTAWQRGEPVDFEGYVDFCLSLYRHPRVSWGLIPDDIPGDARINDALIESWPSKLNHFGVPIWHPDEPISRFRRLCENWRTVAIGGSDEFPSPGSENWWTRMIPAMDEVTDERGRPIANLHGLRLMDPEIFQHLPLTSADSSNAVSNAGAEQRFGSYPPPSKAQRAAVIADRIESHFSPPVWERVEQKTLFPQATARSS